MATTTKSTPSWRDVLLIHPAAELFPRMTPDELRELGEDIRKNGLTSPIVLWQADAKAPVYLLDGRNRLDAIELAMGMRAIKKAWNDLANDKFVFATTSDPYAFVISANIRRHHLTAEQKRDLIAKLLKAAPEKSDRQIAETVKASPTTVGTVRAKMEAKGEVSKLDTRTDAKGVKQPATKERKPPRRPAKKKQEIIHERQALVHRLVVADRKLVVLLSKFFGKYPDQLAAFFADVSISATEIEGEEEEDGDGDSARGAAEASAEAMKVRFAEVDVDDGLDIPASLRRTAP